MDREAGGNPWLNAEGPRGAEYDERFARLAAQGHDVHGEADLMASLGLRSVLDAGCGTGRVAIEMSRRGLEVAGVDLDTAMLGVARDKAPHIEWTHADLVDVDLGRCFDGVVMAGNVMIFVTPGTEGAVLANMARHLEVGGLLVAGFSLGRDRLALDAYDELAEATGLDLAERWADWARTPFVTAAEYAVSIHRRR
ncbi:MAG TPA: class I SAM-dependent methyltransferase [Acidimicrobiales bacterium]|nr:class I SAM-dependent methyltransferase [Acidimicrobiales bacterium]